MSSAIVTLIAVILALSAWMAIHAAVAKDQQRWIQGEMLHIKNAIDERFAMYTNSLIHARSFLMSQTDVDLKKYSQYINNLEMQHYYPGFLGLGFAEIVATPQLFAHEEKMRKIYPNYRVWPTGGREYYAPVVAIEPLNEANQRVIGFDLSSDPDRERAMELSRQNDNPTLSSPVHLVQDVGSNDKDGFLFFLPIFEGKRLVGYVYAPLLADQFFDAVFGMPNFKGERVNFTVTASPDSEVPSFYERFPNRWSKTSEIVSEMNLSGPLRNWHLRVQALPHAFPIYYLYFPDLIGLLFLFGAGLIIYSIQRTSHQFHLEDEYKNRLIQSELRVRRYSDTMFRLNRSSKAIFSEINLDELLKKIALVTADVTQMPQVAIFSLKQEDSVETFGLRYFYGDKGSMQLATEIPMAEFQSWVDGQNKNVIHPSCMGATLVSSRLFLQQPRNWILIPIMKRSERPIGFIVAVSQAVTTIDDQTLTILESLSSQIATALENSFLLSQAEEASRLKTAFLANMSHEIRTPLGAIIGYADILSRRQRLPDSLDIAKNMKRNVEQVTRLIDDILDISKIEANKLVIMPQWVALRSVIDDVNSLMLMKAQGKRIQIEVYCQPDLPKFVLCDGIRLKQILMNLVGNAIKFTEKGSVHIFVNYFSDTQKLVIRVEDTGCGIPNLAQASLFQAFSQADDSSTRKFGGTGLGLALSRRLARMLGGEVRLISSQLGGGSVFELSIQAIPHDGLSAAPEVNFEPPEIFAGLENTTLSDREILLVEDSQDNQDIFKFFLESAGAHVTVANTGLEALRSAEIKDFDLILMDIQIPELDGKETTKILRKKGWSKPILALTAHGLKEERDSIRAAGCDGQITKPVTGDQLVHQVSLALHA